MATNKTSRRRCGDWGQQLQLGISNNMIHRVKLHQQNKLKISTFTAIWCILIQLVVLQSLTITSANSNIIVTNQNYPLGLFSTAAQQRIFSKALNCCKKTENLQCQTECLQRLVEFQLNETLTLNQRTASRANCNDEQQKKKKSSEQNNKLSLLIKLEDFCGQPMANLSTTDFWECIIQSSYFNVDDSSTTNESEMPDCGNHERHSEHIGKANDSFDHETDDDDDNEDEAKVVDNTEQFFPIDYDTIPLATNYVEQWPHFGMNPAKLYCCERASTNICRNLCYSTYNNGWLENWQKFDQFCRYSPQEPTLHQCLDDAESVCKFGCESKLRFCHYFNDHRSIGWFRRCNSQADHEARKLYESWLKQSNEQQQLDNNNSFGVRMNLSRLVNCRKDLWKILSCTLHLKPCFPGNHITSICKSNCAELTDDCSGETNETSTTTKNGSTMLCNILTNSLVNITEMIDYSPTTRQTKLKEQPINNGIISNHQCLNLNQIEIINNRTTLGTTSDESQSIQNACHTNSCQPNQICVRNHYCFFNDCPRYRCLNTCTVGKLKELKIVQDSFFRIPVIDSFDPTIHHAGTKSTKPTINGDYFSDCYNLCYCNSNGKIVDCHFYCMNGTRKVVPETNWNNHNDLIECLASCPDLYDPVCHLETGQIYVNHCVLKCSNIDNRHRIMTTKNNCKQIANFGKIFKIVCFVSAIDGNNKNRLKCIVDENIQLVRLNSDPKPPPVNRSKMSSEQFQILTNRTENLCFIDYDKFKENDLNPVCDNRGIERESLCSLNQLIVDTRGIHNSNNINNNNNNNNVLFSYYGKCLIYCSLLGPVCGRDGQDYQSECAANANHVLVDFFDRCDTKFTTKQSPDKKCPEMICPSDLFVHPLPFNRCLFCGWVEYLRYDSDHFDRISMDSDRSIIKRRLVEYGALTVQTLSKQLRDLITVDKCNLYTHILTDGYLTLLMRPKFTADPRLSLRYHQICQQELIRIVTLIGNRAPIVELRFPLSLLRYNRMVSQKIIDRFEHNHRFNNNSSSSVILSSYYSSFVIVILILILNCIKNNKF